MKRLIVLITISALAVVGACDSPGGNGCNPDTPAPPASTQLTVTGPIGSDVGKGAPFFTAWEDLAKRGYVEEEFFFEGQAASYKIDGEKTTDGLWKVSEADQTPFKSRLLVRRPTDPEKFNGTVVVEWLNVSGGVDACPGWMFNAPFLMREGYVWVGVSAQQVGVRGGGMSMLGNLVQPLVTYDPERYGSLVHPGDAYSYDIYTSAAKVIKGEGTREVLGGLKAEHLIAYGESQSAGTMITYTNAVQPSAKVFDGIFIHSRGANGHPIGEESSGGPGCGVTGDDGLKVRTDLDVPVMQFETETDVSIMGFSAARQPDTDRLRTWEVAGTAHADYYLISRIDAAEVKEAVPEQADLLNCPDGNKGPQYILLRSALKRLDEWIKEGVAPPQADPFEMNGAAIVRDEHGNAKGGVRTPLVDVPIATLKPTGTPIADALEAGGCDSGEEAGGCGAAMSVMCAIFGATEPFSEEKLLELYPTHEEYIEKFKASAEATVAAGFMLEEEAAEIIAEAEAAAVPN